MSPAVLLLSCGTSGVPLLGETVGDVTYPRERSVALLGLGEAAATRSA